MAASKTPGADRTEEAKALARSRDLPNARTASDPDSLKRSFVDHLQYSQAKDEHTATPLDRYFAALISERTHGTPATNHPGLSARYLQRLRDTLTGGSPSALLDAWRARWQSTTPAEVLAATSNFRPAPSVGQ